MYTCAGCVLPDGVPARVVDRRRRVITAEPVRRRRDVCDGGGSWCPAWSTRTATSGSAHTGATDLDEAIEQAETERDAGALLLRDCGSPMDTRSLDDRDDLPRIIRAGRHLARPKRYTPGLADRNRGRIATAGRRRRAGRGRRRLGQARRRLDRPRRSVIWRRCGPTTSSTTAIEAAHANGARVTAHVFGEEALPGLIKAGHRLHRARHRTSPTTRSAEWLEHGTALVPTLINIENFPGIADGRSIPHATQPICGRCTRGCTTGSVPPSRPGSPIYAGTDAGGMVEHGRLVDEIEALHRAGMTREQALAAASWAAREWLGFEGLAEGASADLLVLDADPREDLSALRRPRHIILRGVVID